MAEKTPNEIGMNARFDSMNLVPGQPSPEIRSTNQQADSLNLDEASGLRRAPPRRAKRVVFDVQKEAERHRILRSIRMEEAAREELQRNAKKEDIRRGKEVEENRDEVQKVASSPQSIRVVKLEAHLEDLQERSRKEDIRKGKEVARKFAQEVEQELKELQESRGEDDGGQGAEVGRHLEEKAEEDVPRNSSLQVARDGVLVYRYGVPQKYTPGGIRPNPGDQRVDKDGDRYKQTCRKGHYTVDPYPENLTKDKDCVTSVEDWTLSSSDEDM